METAKQAAAALASGADATNAAVASWEAISDDVMTVDEEARRFIESQTGWDRVKEFWSLTEG